MALKAETMEREFHYKGMRLPDPGPAINVNGVRDIFATTYPELTNAVVDGPEARGNKLVYTFATSAGTKG